MRAPSQGHSLWGTSGGSRRCRTRICARTAPIRMNPLRPHGYHRHSQASLFRPARGRAWAGSARGDPWGGGEGSAGGVVPAQSAAQDGAGGGRAPAAGRRQRPALRGGPLRLPGCADRHHLRVHDHAGLPGGEPVGRRAHGGRGHRRLWARAARTLLRRGSPVPAALQADALGRERGGARALPALGPRPQGGPRHPQRRPDAEARAQRLHHPHRHPRQPADPGRRAAV